MGGIIDTDDDTDKGKENQHYINPKDEVIANPDSSPKSPAGGLVRP